MDEKQLRRLHREGFEIVDDEILEVAFIFNLHNDLLSSISFCVAWFVQIVGEELADNTDYVETKILQQEEFWIYNHMMPRILEATALFCAECQAQWIASLQFFSNDEGRLKVHVDERTVSQITDCQMMSLTSFVLVSFCWIRIVVAPLIVKMILLCISTNNLTRLAQFLHRLLHHPELETSKKEREQKTKPQLKSISEAWDLYSSYSRVLDSDPFPTEASFCLV